MKELKFRVWDKERECYLDETELAGITPDGKYILYIEEEEISRLEVEDNYIVEYDTGFKDQNGNEIYENDILQIDDHILGDFEVLWHNLGWAIKRSVGFETLAVHKSENIVIVGNVHENADLLEELNEN